MIILTKRNSALNLTGRNSLPAAEWKWKTLRHGFKRHGSLTLPQKMETSSLRRIATTKTEADVMNAASEPVAPPASESEPADPDENSGETESEEDEDAVSDDEVEPESEVKPKTTRRTKSK